MSLAQSNVINQIFSYDFSSIKVLSKSKFSILITSLQCLSVCEVGGSGTEELMKCPSLSPAVLWFVKVCERKPR